MSGLGRSQAGQLGTVPNQGVLVGGDRPAEDGNVAAQRGADECLCTNSTPVAFKPLQEAKLACLGECSANHLGLKLDINCSAPLAANAPRRNCRGQDVASEGFICGQRQARLRAWQGVALVPGYNCGARASYMKNFLSCPSAHTVAVIKPSPDIGRFVAACFVIAQWLGPLSRGIAFRNAEWRFGHSVSLILGVGTGHFRSEASKAESSWMFKHKGRGVC
eukprot:scaffold67708_cov44-Prasinocladus_malaysianus.AAC.1